MHYLDHNPHCSWPTGFRPTWTELMRPEQFGNDCNVLSCNILFALGLLGQTLSPNFCRHFYRGYPQALRLGVLGGGLAPRAQVKLPNLCRCPSEFLLSLAKSLVEHSGFRFGAILPVFRLRAFRCLQSFFSKFALRFRLLQISTRTLPVFG